MKYVVIFCFRYCNKHEYSKWDKFLWVCLVVFHLIFDKKTGCCIKISVRKVSCRIGQTHSPNTLHQRSSNFAFLCFYYVRLVCILLAAQHTHSILLRNCILNSNEVYFSSQIVISKNDIFISLTYTHHMVQLI